jgi:ABC-type multidrug transport system ATPase subunit
MIRVRPQEPAGVRLAGQLAEPLVLEGCEIASTDLRVLLDGFERESARKARLAKTLADLEQVRHDSPLSRSQSAGAILPRARPRLAAVVRARDLAKRYGDKRVLRGLDLDVPRGGFVLVTGPNGSGKTTLLRLVAGLAAPSGGELDVGVDRARIGLLAHEPLVYRELTALENLELFGRLYRVPERRERIGMLLERYGLWDVRAQRAGAFSRGMLQRLALCRALLHDPELLLLDEPFNALDASGTVLLERELAELRPARTFLVATHDPERLAPLATDRVVFG